MPKISFTTDELKIIRETVEAINTRTMMDIKFDYGYEKVKSAFSKLGLKT